MSDFSDLKKSLKTHEGCVSYMYLDTEGHVTIGVGHMIACCGDAEQLKFVLRQAGMGATAAEIAHDFNQVTQQQKAKLFTHYKQFTMLDMPADAIEALLDADIAEKEAGVRQRFRGYDTYPPEAKTALLDMAFNLGVAGLASKFPRLKAAAEAGDWNSCAAQCERKGIQESRNLWTKQQFQRASSAASSRAHA
jgi:GH24 family phage-related lysozyme (muramidase)